MCWKVLKNGYFDIRHRHVGKYILLRLRTPYPERPPGSLSTVLDVFNGDLLPSPADVDFTPTSFVPPFCFFFFAFPETSIVCERSKMFDSVEGRPFGMFCFLRVLPVSAKKFAFFSTNEPLKFRCNKTKSYFFQIILQ